MEEFASFVSHVTSSVVVSSFVRFKILEEFYKVKFEKARAEREKKAAAQSVSSSSGSSGDAVPKSFSSAPQSATSHETDSETDSETDNETDNETDSGRRAYPRKVSSTSTSTSDAPPTFSAGMMYDEVKKTLSLSNYEVMDFMNIHNIVISAIESAAKQLTFSKENAKKISAAAPSQVAPSQAAPSQVAPSQGADNMSEYFVRFQADRSKEGSNGRETTVDGFSIHMHSSPSSARRASSKRKAAQVSGQRLKKKKRRPSTTSVLQVSPRKAIKFKHARETPYPRFRAQARSFSAREARALEKKIKDGFKGTLIREFYDSERAKEDGMFKDRNFRSYQQMVYRMKKQMGN